MDYKEYSNHFTYQELIDAYASLSKIEKVIDTISTTEDSSLDFNYCSLDIIEGIYHVYFGFNSTSYTGDTKEIILGKIKFIKSDLEKAIKESLEKIQN